MKTVFGTVAYESAWEYMEEFCQSLNQQTDQDFSVLIVCDQLSQTHVQALRRKIKPKLFVVQMEVPLSIPLLRVELIRQAKQLGSDLLILGDFDDLFGQNRICKVKQAYERNCGSAFFYHQLANFSGEDLFQFLPEQSSDITAILESNFCGLSNTALNMKKIDMDFINSLAACKTPVFDWYLFSRLLLSGLRGSHTPEAKTFYRIHGNNMAGVARQNRQAYEKELDVKKRHYTLLKDKDERIHALYEVYSPLTAAELSDGKAGYQNRTLLGYWWEMIKIN